MRPSVRSNQCLFAALLCTFLWGCGSATEESNDPEASAGTSGSTASTTDTTAKSDQDPSGTKPGTDDSPGPSDPIAAKDFPKPPDAGPSIYTAETNTVMFHQTGKVEDQAKFYSDKLTALGWKKLPTSEIVEGVAFLDFAGKDLSISVTINSRGDKITTMAQGSGLDAPEELDIINEEDPVPGAG